MARGGGRDVSDTSAVVSCCDGGSMDVDVGRFGSLFFALEEYVRGEE